MLACTRLSLAIGDEVDLPASDAEQTAALVKMASGSCENGLIAVVSSQRFADAAEALGTGNATTIFGHVLSARRKQT